jgi:hypothetical protein
VFVCSFVRSPTDREGSSILLIEGWGQGTLNPTRIHEDYTGGPG